MARHDDEKMGQGVAACEVGKIKEKAPEDIRLKVEDVVMLTGVIALDVLEEREDEVRGGGDGNKEKGLYPTAHREFVERIKEKQGKLESAMVLLVGKHLG
ncbi:uncharacterized protein MONOS_5075 [Monocercomonoides exilis]|uniref:uncharacterized protein n=1 Tax=Monocercomonoides exilis TaxID=2049356 RepID=UPI003559826D|nr:hypothetical protein MONOS_5075 [Monocercomonoides exilis]|eukprot:MONOS_5075.1-p1 / transcript=MONOS_5075.1 / gene=MONOS_5075 / organism=Monocercomonoides_exilis_PA203 / gene_product=unspecified product / transcript_product=unspecified product / location=Mono_scaffold00144:28224-28523(+) / protein_length=100 / sequence_SO=supercontig / SO=protein_coding / is_pseudo=false